MPYTWCLVFMLAISAASLLATPPPATAMDTIYEVLDYYGFPPGLVPKDVVESFDLNPNNGQLTVNLNRTCSFPAFRYEVLFKSQISGVIMKKDIKSIRGVEVKILNYFWAKMVAIEVTEGGNEIEFTVGRSTADFPFLDFYHIPECGCGFDCGHSVAGDWSS